MSPKRMGGVDVDEFTYLSILISFVLGLGVANLLTGLAALIRARASTKMDMDDSPLILIKAVA